MDSEFMSKLNEGQLEAVVSDAKSLQILAGPGTGKTRVLTARVAWLVKEKKVDPSKIIVVTFTNKAAKEMRTRLESKELLGVETSSRLRMGTFHSLCAFLLRLFPGDVGLKRNFSIADTDISKRLIKKLLVELKPKLSGFGKTMTADSYFSRISAAKCRGMDCHSFAAANANKYDMKDTILVFHAYEKRLHSENLVDFDNLLLLARTLLKYNRRIPKMINHVLVDEFQDTNAVQYDIIKYLTRDDKHLTIVGDPDQSIFGWRNADKESFLKMRKDYPDTVVAVLDQNYRSCKSILEASHHVVSLDKKRIDKSLTTFNPQGPPMSLLSMKNEISEAQTVAEEIARIIKYSDSVIEYKDIAVLVRMNFMTNSVEQALRALSIPYVVVGGVRFFDREEVKDIVMYLAFAYNPNNTDAFERIANVPRRGIGEVSLNKILSTARESGSDVMEVLRHVTGNSSGGRLPSISLSSKVRSNLQDLYLLLTDVQEMIQEKKEISDILKEIVGRIDYKNHLKRYHEKDDESRWENVGQLISFSKQFKVAKPPPKEQSQQVDPDLKEIESLTETIETPISAFLEAATLSADQKEHDEAKSGKVTLCTMHTSKGLEWPCVFIVGCVQGTIPHGRAEDLMEEARLLYVAMTRAKCFLYCSLPLMKSSFGKQDSAMLSSFLSEMSSSLCTHKTPTWDMEVREWVAKMLQRPVPAESKSLESIGSAIWLGDGARHSRYSSYYDDFSAFDDFDQEDYDDVYDDHATYTNYYPRNNWSASNRNSVPASGLYSLTRKIQVKSEVKLTGFVPASQLITSAASGSLSQPLVHHQNALAKRPRPMQTTSISTVNPESAPPAISSSMVMSKKVKSDASDQKLYIPKRRKP